MRKSKTLAKVRAGKPVKLAFMGHLIPPFVAYAADVGYDAIWIDLEHRSMGVREVQLLLSYCHLFDIDGIIRTPTREKSQLYRYLEDGAAGLIIPLIENAAEAEDIVSKTKFPPLGDRGLEGRGLDALFGLDTRGVDGKSNFIAHQNDETVIIAQIESPSAASKVSEMAAVDGIDILFAGPTDYTIRATPDDPSFDDALKTLARTCSEHGKAWGAMPTTIEQVRDYAARGAQFIPYGIDSRIVMDGLGSAGAELEDAYGG